MAVLIGPILAVGLALKCRVRIRWDSSGKSIYGKAKKARKGVCQQKGGAWRGGWQPGLKIRLKL